MQTGTRNRGFSSMDRERQREIARKGGRAAHEKGTAHEFTAEEARAAGRKGGERVSADRAHMSRIGRLGGKCAADRRTSKSSSEGCDGDTAIASRTGAFSGIGFAIPVNEARFVYTSLKDHGNVVRGWLGASIADVSQDPKLATSFGYKNATGVLVESTLPGAPAAGKLESGDIIESLNGKPAENVVQLRNAIASCAPGTEIKMTVWRDNKDAPGTVKLGTQPKDLSAASGYGTAQGENADNAMGMTLSNATDELARRFNLGDDRPGALVTHVKHGSPADKAGLRPGDLIKKIDDKAVKTASETTDLLSKGDVKKGVRLYVKGPEGSRFVFIEAN